MEGAAINADIGCSICEGLDGATVKCCRCLVRVHPSCYGIPIIQQEPNDGFGWRCERCYFVTVRQDPLDEDTEPLNANCEYCPRQDGALKLFRYDYLEENTYWAHVRCVQLHQMFRYDDAVDKQGTRLKQKVIITKGYKEFKECFERLCKICKSEAGLAIQCTGRDGMRHCKESFHVGCASANGSLKYVRAICYLLYGTTNTSSMKILCMKHLVSAVKELRQNSEAYTKRLDNGSYTDKQNMGVLIKHVEDYERELSDKKPKESAKEQEPSVADSIQRSVISLSSGSALDADKYKPIRKRGSSSRRVIKNCRKQIVKESSKQASPKKSLKKGRVKKSAIKSSRLDESLSQAVQGTPSVRSSVEVLQPVPPKIKAKKSVTVEVSPPIELSSSRPQVSKSIPSSGVGIVRQEEQTPSNEDRIQATGPSNKKPLNALFFCDQEHLYFPTNCFLHLSRFKEVAKLDSTNGKDPTYPMLPTATELPLFTPARNLV